MSKEWDIALTNHSSSHVLVRMPVALSRSLRDASMNRAKLRVTNAGILLVPYAGEPSDPSGEKVELPEWGSA